MKVADRCVALGCTRVATSRVRVYWRLISHNIVRADKGSGRALATAPVCPGHEHALAAGDTLRISSRISLPEMIAA